MAKLRGPSEYVYFVEAPALSRIKIGYSAQSPDSRIASLATASPVPLERMALIRGSYLLEQLLHWRFAANHSHLEWFHASDALTGFVRSYASPWVGPVIHAIEVQAIERDVMKADPWFRKAATRLAKSKVSDPDYGVVRRDADIFRLMKALPFTASVIERATVNATRAAFLDETVNVAFRGGPSNGQIVKFPRRQIARIVREGVMEQWKGQCHVYVVSAEGDVSDQMVTAHYRPT